MRRHYRVLTELYSLSALLRPRHLSEEGPRDEDLHKHGDDKLYDQQDDGGRTLLCNAPEAVANGRLRFQREQEGPGQSLHLHHTGGVVRWRIELE